MWPDRVSNPGPLTYESGALPTALGGPAHLEPSYLDLPGLQMKIVISKDLRINISYHSVFAGS